MIPTEHGFNLEAVGTVHSNSPVIEETDIHILYVGIDAR